MSLAGPRPHFSPLDTSSNSITPFDPRLTVTTPSKSCVAEGMNTPTHFFSASSTSGRLTSCGMCGEPISFAFGYHHQVHRQFLARTANGMQRCEERCFRSFLVHRATADDHLPQRRFVHYSRFGRRRRPFCRIELFHVVHEIKTDSFRSTCIKRREYAGFAVRVDHRCLLKSCIASELSHVFRAFRIAAVLRRDRHLSDPIL